MSIGEAIRGELIAAGRQGVNVTDLHRQLKLAGLTRGGTAASFHFYFLNLARAGYVVPTGVTEPGHSKTVPTLELVSRKFWRITPKGRRGIDWRNLYALVHPDVRDTMRERAAQRRRAAREARLAQGLPLRGRGRPRTALPA
jgi:hypothetical protein